MKRPEASADAPPPRRTVRSFVTRAGRISNAQQRALDTLLPRWSIAFRQSPLDFADVFGREAPTVLEIGFGMGETTAEMAQLRSDVNFIGIEVHTPGVGALLNRIEALSLANLRIIQHDAVEVLALMIPEATLAGMHIFFPDPWPKARHHKRRLIQAPFVRLAATRLLPGAYLHCATDWQPYAQQIDEVLRAEPRLAVSAMERSNALLTRPQTKFEARGLRLGHEVCDLVFVRRTETPG